LGKLWGKKDGFARALMPEKRKEIAKKVATKWRGK